MHPYQSSPVEPNQAYQFAQLSNLLLHYSPMATTTAPPIKPILKIKHKKIKEKEKKNHL